MPLTKSQIIEVQEAAKFNTLKLMREAEDQKEFKKTVARKITEASNPEVVKAKVAKEAQAFVNVEKSAKAEETTKKGK